MAREKKVVFNTFFFIYIKFKSLLYFKDSPLQTFCGNGLNCDSIDRLLVQHTLIPGFNPKHGMKAGTVMPVCNPNPGEVEAGRSEVQSHPRLYNKFKTSLIFNETLS